MKDALVHMIESGETSKKNQTCIPGRGPPIVYEKAIQKLEADIRGHIRLEHEMKIHMDYLESKIEKFEKEREASEKEAKERQ
jgi:hypothetical protein